MQQETPERLAPATSHPILPVNAPQCAPTRDGVTSEIPRLLVSVRSPEEAALAIRGGCDILDIKDPGRGSLGMAAPAVIRQITQVVGQQALSVAVTAALGEVHEYRATGPICTDGQSTAGDTAARGRFASSQESDLTRGALVLRIENSTSEDRLDLPAELNLVKLGCARLLDVPDWRQRWATVRESFADTLSPQTGWVAVAYADWKLAEAPRPDEIVAEALQAGCRGVLFDTYAKTGRGLLDWIAVSRLQQIAEQLHFAGRFLALAGSLRARDLPHLSAIPADIIAIRGAACGHGQRTNGIVESAVRDFRSALRQNWNSSSALGSC